MALQKRIGRLLKILLIASFFNGLCWAGMVPLWHTPDEQAHFAQAQNMVTGRKNMAFIPTTSKDIVLSEKLLGTYRVNGNNLFTYHPEYRIEYANQISHDGIVVHGPKEQEIESMPIDWRKEFVITEATGYPPLYYWYIAAVNKIFWENGLIVRVFISRLATVLITTLAVYISYLLASEIFKNKYYALLSASLVSFHPMWRFIGSGVTSDAMMNLVYPFLVLSFLYFWREKRNGLRLLLAVFILALATKIQSLLFLVILVPGVVIYWTKGKHLDRLDKFLILITTGALGLTGLIVTGNYIFPNETLNLFDSLGIKESNYWFYLPELSVFGSNINLTGYLRAMGSELYRQTFPWYWGVYRWLSLTLPLWIYRVIKVAILVSILGWIWGAIKYFKINNKRGWIMKNRSWIMIFASSLVYAMGILGWNFLFWRSHGYSFGIQGRYFFPNLPEHMILLLAGFLLLPLHSVFKKLIAIVLVLGMTVFNWYSLYFVSASYYDATNWARFIVQTSQYKPWFFKFPLLIAIIIIGVLTTLHFLRLLVRYSKERDK